MARGAAGMARLGHGRRGCMHGRARCGGGLSREQPHRMAARDLGLATLGPRPLCSTWVTINAETRKLAKLPEGVRERWLPLAARADRAALPAGDTRRKLPEMPGGGAAAYAGPHVTARRGDMDPNGHINNGAPHAGTACIA